MGPAIATPGFVFLCAAVFVAYLCFKASRPTKA